MIIQNENAIELNFDYSESQKEILEALKEDGLIYSHGNFYEIPNENYYQLDSFYKKWIGLPEEFSGTARVRLQGPGLLFDESCLLLDYYDEQGNLISVSKDGFFLKSESKIEYEIPEEISESLNLISEYNSLPSKKKDNSGFAKFGQLKKSCKNCGSELLYAPGTSDLKCEYCGHSVTIEASETELEELALQNYLGEMGQQSHSEEITMIQCKNCGANQHIEENYKSLHCVYCATPLIVEDMYKEEWIVPGAVLPFQIAQEQAHQIFQKWVKGLWFAPNNLQKATLDPQNTKGLYAPYWTFDAQLYADYTGQRGEYYYVTKTVGSGKNRRTVQERRTNWYPAAGNVSGFVDDTLTKASKQKSGVIPKDIERWNLKLLKPFDSSFLSGFVTRYNLIAAYYHLSHAINFFSSH